jgi:hypothetical protein
MWKRLNPVLQSRHAPALLGALAVLLSLPSLGLGLQTDDHLLMLRLEEGATPADLFTAVPERVGEQRERGVFAWWSSPAFEIRFFRPLSALSHALEGALWPDAAWAMHLVNALLYGLLVTLAALLYRHILGAGSTAGLAALLFTVDEGHALAVGWISSRNTVLAAVFALLALLLHVRGREQPALVYTIASPICTGLALLSGELGLSALTLLVAYAGWLDGGSRRARWSALGPHAVVALIWGGVYVAQGYGVHDTGWYRDVRAEPLGSLLQAVLDLPVWALVELGPSVATATASLPANPVRLVALVLVVPLLAVMIPSLHGSRHARFFAVAMLLSTLPLCTTMPQDRVLVCASFGAFGWIACVLEDRAREASRTWRVGSRVLATVHLVVAPLLFIPMLRSLEGVDRASQALADALPDGARDVVVVNLPMELLSAYAPAIRLRAGAPQPASLHQLYAGASELTVERVDDRTLDVIAWTGWGRIPFERLFASERHLRSVETAAAAGLHARVVERLADGRPLRVRFEFPDRLEASGRQWLIWGGAGPVAWKPPASGAQEPLQPLQALEVFNR